MAWKENPSDATPKTKSSLNRFLEIVKSERLVINRISRTSKPIQNGKNARKFPDSKRDFCIEFSITSQTGKISLPICYEQFAGEEEAPLLRYTLAVTGIQRYSADEILPEEPASVSCCCCPLVEHRAGRKRKVYGFWLRCFGRKVTFRITIAIKLCGLHYLTKCNGSKVQASAEWSNDNVVCLQVFEFGNCPRTKSVGTIFKECQPVAKIFPALYTDEDYKTFMNTARSLNPDNLGISLAQSSINTDLTCDLKVVAQLERSLEACRKGYIEKAKQTVKGAVDLVNKCSSKVLLTGRAYLYLARIHLKDGCIGNVEECLQLARKKLQNIESCEDVGDLNYQEGEMLVAFVKKVPRLGEQLIPTARQKFKEAALHYKEGLNVGGAVNKLCCSHIQLASLAFQENPSTKGSNMTYDAITRAQGHITLVQAHLSNLSLQVQFDYYLCYSKLLLEMKLLEQARENLKVALQIAEDSPVGEEIVLNSELVEEMYDQLHGSNSSEHTEERLDQFAVIARATAAADYNDIIYLGYLGDISA